MPTTVLIPAAQAILNFLIPLVTEQIKLAWGFEKDLRKLQRRLENIQALLCDAGKGHIESEILKKWLKSLTSVACDAENVLGELAYEAHRRKLERKRDQVRNFFSSSNQLAFRLNMANRVNDINLLLDEICKEANDMGMRPTEQLMTPFVPPSEWRPTIPFVDKSRCVGRDGDVVVVRDMVLGSKDDLSVIAIVGMAGLGKTTLAQLVYHDKKVVECFGDNKMWICVSIDFNVKRLLNEMVQILFRQDSNIQNTEAIVGKLGEKLKGKKYLLVLDDVWNTSPQIWEELRSSLIGIEASEESKIMVTTRSEVVASTMQVPESRTHRVRELSPEDSWTMFRKKAFAIGGPKETKPFVDIGGRMVKKCKGVPLAITSLGGLLYDKKSPTEWEDIDASEIWRGEGEILPALRLSFQHLPSPSLKQCFAYCSIFPKDELLMKDVLIQLWLSLGYLQSPPNRTLEMEDVGNDYFNILLRNSLFQDVVLDDFNNIIACKMHDLVHDLAIAVSEGSCLILKASEVKDHPDVQHLSLRPNYQETRLEFPNETIGKLRTLFLTGNLPQINIDDVKSIRALSIENPDAEQFSSSIGKFVHLKYLGLSKFCSLKVPNSITKLYNLETLRLHHCSGLEEIQTEFHKLVSLRHFCVEDTEINRKMIPTMIGHLTSLRTLPFFSVGEDEGHKIEELGGLSKLRGTLIIYNLQHVKDEEEAKRAKIFEKPKITELKFCWGWNPRASGFNNEVVLEGLKPHKNLRGLILTNFGGRRLASWMRRRDDQLLHYLVKIKLIHCKLCEEIPILGHLPCLEVVEMVQLDNVESIGPEFYGLDKGVVGGNSIVVFPALRQLTIRGMQNLKEWSDIPPLPPATMSRVGFFPCLEDLDISGCPNLIAIPGHLLSIQDLRIGEKRGALWSKRFNSDTKEKLYIPRLTLQVDPDSENIGTLIEHFLERSSKSLRLLQITNLKELRHLPKHQFFHYLVKIKLINCKLCEEIPILGHLPCLEVLEMVQLDNVESIGPEFYGLNEGMVGGSTIAVFPALRQLTICGMQKLKEWSDIPPLPPATMSRVGFFPCLEELDISECPNLIAIPGHLLSIQDLHIGEERGGFWSKLFKLDIKEKSYIPRLTLQVDSDSENIGTLIEHLLESSSKSLRVLQITRLKELLHLPKHLLNLASLEALAIVHCPKLMHMREETRADVNRLTSLREILITWCDELTCLPKVLLQPTLVSLELQDCDNLMVPYECCNLTSLQKLSISNCEKLTCFPKGLLQPTLLSLEISGCRNLMAANPDELRNLTSLQKLVLEWPNSQWLRCWEEGQFCLTTLRTLQLQCGSRELDYLPWPVVEMAKAPNPQHYPFISLEFLWLEGFPKLKCLPVQLGYLTSLRKLVISGFNGLEALPDWLGNFSSLESLTLLCGSSLRSFPSLERFQLLKNLHSLVIMKCPLLKERCMEGDEEWCKIASIPSLKVYYDDWPDHITI